MGDTSVQMPACLVSSKSGAGVPSEPPLITSRHWLTFAVESLKKLYNKTYIALKICDIPYWAGPTSLNSRPLLSYNVLECGVLYRCEFMLRQCLHDDAPLSQSLL